MTNPFALPDGPVQIAVSGGRTSAYMLHEILHANGAVPGRGRGVHRMSSPDTDAPDPIRTCATCRFFSYMVAEASGDQIRAMCLSATSPHMHEMVVESQSCESWKDGGAGAVDVPWGNPYDPDGRDP